MAGLVVGAGVENGCNTSIIMLARVQWLGDVGVNGRATDMIVAN